MVRVFTQERLTFSPMCLVDRLSTITATDLTSALAGNPEALDVHLMLVERDVHIEGHSVKIHRHYLTNGRVHPHRLAEFGC
jgi:hypothetical protein